MHILTGVILLAIAVGAVFLIVQGGVFQPITGSLGDIFQGSRSTSTPSNVSPYHGQVRVQFVSTGSGLDKTQVISLLGNPPKDDGIVMTGWTLKVNKKTFSVPKTINVYSPSVAGVPPEDIYLRAGGVVNFYSGKNPQKNQDQAIRSGLFEWRIWLGEDFLAVPHGTVTLRDAKGKTVDEYKY